MVLAWWWGCVGNGGKDGTDAAGPHCVDTETVIAGDEPTALGLTSDEVAALAEGTSSQPFSWADGRQTTVSLGFAPTGEAWFVDSEPVPGDGTVTPAIYVYCEDRVEVGVTFDFATEDGAFAESWDERLSAVAAGSASLRHDLALDTLAGSFALEPFVESPDYDELRAWVALTVTGPTASSGVVEGQASGEEDCAEGDTCAAWAEQVDVATWGEQDTPPGEG